MIRKLTLSVAPTLLFFFCIIQNMQAQVLNDDCTSAIHIDNPGQYCTAPDGETNFGALPSTVPIPSCFNNAFQDVWYSFEATAANMEVFVFSSIFSSMSGPAIAIYSGNCPNGLTELACAANLQGGGFQKLNASNLSIGQTYFIRIDALGSGAFQLCTFNSSPADEITGDCPTAIFVCDKEQREVQFVAGPGNDPTEWNDATCLTGFPGESNASWFTFTASSSGTLEFTLTPVNPADDLDFVVYHLPNGPGDCTDKILERCMAAGNFGIGAPCTGATGLNATSIDISEPPGCFNGADNFLQYMDLIAGETYALSVNNFTSSGSGFMIDWGGAAQFEGPKVGFKTDDADNVICLGEAIVFTDTSSFTNGTIESWQWTFGANASPFSDTTKGPNTVQYLNKGKKTVELTVRTDLGCTLKKSLDIQVDSCCAIMASVNLLPDCLPDTSCQMAVAVVENAVAPLQYTWSSGQTDSIATMLQGGNYTLIVKDVFGCADTVDFTVDQLRIFEIPNAFTPNSDQANDVFQPVSVALDIEVLQIEVWNRWGILVHNGTNNGWDGNIKGKPAPSDVYVYRIKIRYPDGREEVRTKDVTLLR